MARREQDREDILREATALVRRVEFELPEFAEPVTVGFRRDGSASFYFGADLVLQFNSRGELRRAYRDGRLIKADHGNLFSMEKHRAEHEIELRTHALTAEETDAFLQLAQQHLIALQTAFQSQTIRALRQVPPRDDIVGEIVAWLDRQDNHIMVARAPNAR